MSTCPKCGGNVPDGAKFCPECSYNLTEQNDGANNATQAEFHAQPAYNPQQPNNSVPPQGYDSYQAPPAAAWLYALPAISQWWWNTNESNCAVGLVDHQLDLLLPSARNCGPCFYTYCQK